MLSSSLSEDLEGTWRGPGSLVTPWGLAHHRRLLFEVGSGSAWTNKRTRRFSQENVYLKVFCWRDSGVPVSNTSCLTSEGHDLQSLHQTLSPFVLLSILVWVPIKGNLNSQVNTCVSKNGALLKAAISSLGSTPVRCPLHHHVLPAPTGLKPDVTARARCWTRWNPCR